MDQVALNLAEIHRRVAAAAARAGRDPAAVQLVAVSKTHPAAAVHQAAAAGQKVFGESRVQEAKEKIPACPPGLEWHFIGHLQKNKIRHALPMFDFFHSIDSLPLAQAINRIAQETGRTVSGLLEVNVSGEASKHGFSVEQLRADFSVLSSLRQLRLLGLMTMAPYAEDPDHARPFFRTLRELRDELQQKHGADLPHLSMGMSGDFEPAIEEGATLIRIGSFIFGERPAA